jgi:hypothetical protein
MGANQSHQIPPPPKPNEHSSEEGERPIFPSPTGHEYDAIDKLQAELPAIIDEESQQQVDDYKEACDNGKGPVSGCRDTVVTCWCMKHCCPSSSRYNILTRFDRQSAPDGGLFCHGRISVHV